MEHRFTRKSRIGRARIPRHIREEVFRRDDYNCQFCGNKFDREQLTIDHLIPLSRAGLDEITNYITCCQLCNQRKANLPLAEFAKSVDIPIEALPVHGDPVIDNEALPIQIRLLRKRIFDKARRGRIRITGRTAQKKLERVYRREFWHTTEGRRIEAEFASLPGQVRVMIPEILAIARNEREYLLLIELAKSANTRNLIGSALTPDSDVSKRLKSIENSTKDEALKRRIIQAQQRFEKELRRRGLPENSAS